MLEIDKINGEQKCCKCKEKKDCYFLQIPFTTDYQKNFIICGVCINSVKNNNLLQTQLGIKDLKEFEKKLKECDLK